MRSSVLPAGPSRPHPSQSAAPNYKEEIKQGSLISSLVVMLVVMVVKVVVVVVVVI